MTERELHLNNVEELRAQLDEHQLSELRIFSENGESLLLRDVSYDGPRDAIVIEVQRS